MKYIKTILALLIGLIFTISCATMQPETKEPTEEESDGLDAKPYRPDDLKRGVPNRVYRY